jgi:2'-5' RNA ligase
MQTSLPQYPCFDYLLVLNPHEELRNRIRSIKKEFAEKYDAPMANYLKPYMALVSFRTIGMMEERLLQRLQVIAMGTSPFKVELSKYAAFPSHTIYIDVATKLPVQALVKELKQAQRMMKLSKDHKPHFMEEPHIAICRKLKPWQFEKGWLEYSHRSFTGRFVADSMLLLKRPADQIGAWQVAKRLEFMNLPVATKQGSLFGEGNW